MPEAKEDLETIVEDDDGGFGESFRKVAEAGGQPTGTKEEEKKEPTEKSEEELAEEARVKEEEAKSKAEADAKNKPPEKDDFQHKYETLQGMFNKLVEEVKELKAGKAESPKKQEPPKEEEETDEEIVEFLKEFDYLAKPMQKIVEKLLDKRLEKAAEEIQEVRKEAAFKTEESTRMLADFVISATHPDFLRLRDTGEVKRWVETLAGTEKALYDKIYKEGSVEEVIDMLTAYKKATKVEKPPEKTKEELEKEEQKKEKLNNLTVVRTKLGAINTDSGKRGDDYESAFQRRAEEIEKKK